MQHVKGQDFADMGLLICLVPGVRLPCTGTLHTGIADHRGAVPGADWLSRAAVMSRLASVLQVNGSCQRIR